LPWLLNSSGFSHPFPAIDQRWPEFGSISPFILANLVFLGVVCSALEYLSTSTPVKRLGATVSTTFLNLIPIVTVVSGTLLFAGKVALDRGLGMGLIIGEHYALNRVTISHKTASDVKKKLQPSSAKRGFAIRDILSILRP
jgi:drug/metabolite transporter (DMT)-like permease